MSSSAKSMPASRAAIRAISCCFIGADLAGEGAAELLRGDAGLVEGGGFDQVVNCFGLCEIEATGEEGSLGEFAGFGEAGAGGDALAE